MNRRPLSATGLTDEDMRKLKVIAAITGKTQEHVLGRIVRDALEDEYATACSLGR